MTEVPAMAHTIEDQPYFDPTAYGSGPDDCVTDPCENGAVTQHTVKIRGTEIAYTARAGHLTTRDPYSARPAATIFYVSFSSNAPNSCARPVTFFYNGGPGSSSVFLLLGSFGPRRIKTNYPHFTPPATYEMQDNQDSLLDQSDLVFLNPVGTGYSAAIAPSRNRDFWGVDEDARCIRQFIKRYLTAFNRWNSPKFLFGESYGTPRTCVLAWLLHEDGVDLNGVILQSSVLDYAQANNPVGLLPTLAAIAWYHDKVTLFPRLPDLRSFLKEVKHFTRKLYGPAKDGFPNVDPKVLRFLSEILGIPQEVLHYWKLDPSTSFLTSLLLDEGRALGAYDGRVTAEDTGIAGSVDPNSGGNDPTMNAIGGVYTAMWNEYLRNELKFESLSPFIDMNDQAFQNWNFAHVDPTGAEKGGKAALYTAGDLAAAMSLNQYLRVFSANGYYDAVTPFFQAELNLEKMLLSSSSRTRGNLELHNYESGHMIYLDDRSRTGMKAHLAEFYAKSISAAHGQAAALMALAATKRETISYSPYQRRVGRTPY